MKKVSLQLIQTGCYMFERIWRWPVMTGKAFHSILARRLLWQILYRPFKHTHTCKAQKHVYGSWKDILDNLLLTPAFPQKSYTTGTVKSLKIISPLFILLDGPHTRWVSVIKYIPAEQLENGGVKECVRFPYNLSNYQALFPLHSKLCPYAANAHKRVERHK